MTSRFLAAAGAAALLAACAGHAQAESTACADYNLTPAAFYFAGTGLIQSFAFDLSEQLTVRVSDLSGPGAGFDFEIDTPRLGGLELDQNYTSAPALESYVFVAGDEPSQQVSIGGTGAFGQTASFQLTCQFDVASVSGLSPTYGPPVGGNTVVITGDNLGAATDVTFNGASVSFTVDSNTQITAVAPVGVLTAIVNVQIIAGNGNSDVSGASDDYTYAFPPPPVPTLTEWAMILMGVILAGMGGLVAMRRKGLA